MTAKEAAHQLPHSVSQVGFLYPLTGQQPYTLHLAWNPVWHDGERKREE